MCWGVSPSSVHASGFSPDATAEPLISRELLRTMCEPFFEQMITTMQQALSQAQMNERNREMQTMQATTHMAKSQSFQPLVHPSHPPLYTSSLLGTMLDEESTEADELGAFASLLSGPCSEVDSIDAVEPRSPETEAPSQASHEDSEQNIDLEKSTMVCRHWKSKGWCRMGSNCKFLHPEHKRGVGATKSCSDGCTNGGISGVACPGMSTISSQPDAISMEVEFPPLSVARRKKRGGKGRSNRGQDVQLGETQQEAANTQLQVAGIFCGGLA